MKRILSRIIIILGLFTVVSALTSCDVHQWPESDTPDDPKTTAKLKLSLKYLTDFTYRDHTYDVKTGAVSDGQNGNDYDNLDNIAPGTPMLVTIKVHRDNAGKTPVTSSTFTTVLNNNYDCDVELEVPSGDNYIITAWGHLLDGNGDSFYNSGDFNAISLVKEKYRGNTDMRDAFRGRLLLSVPDTQDYSEVVYMKRPMGKLEFVTTDLQEFLANEEKRQSLGTRAVSVNDYKIVISYPAYYPTSYHAMDDRLENSGTGYNFTGTFTDDGNNTGEISIGFDYVLLNDIKDAGVQAQVTVYHADGTMVSTTGMITIPMERDYHVVLRGKFLTANGSGGVGIDPDFEGDFNIPIQ